MVTDEAIPALTFGDEIRERRTALIPPVGQSELAEIADVSRNTISNLERGETAVSLKVKKRIQEALSRLESSSEAPGDFGVEIKEARTAMDLTQGALATAAGVSRGTIRNLEEGLTEATRSTRAQITAALARLGADVSAPAAEKQLAFRLREDIAQEIEAQLAPYPEAVFPEGSDTPEGRYIAAMRHAYRTAARIARGEGQ